LYGSNRTASELNSKPSSKTSLPRHGPLIRWAILMLLLGGATVGSAPAVDAQEACRWEAHFARALGIAQAGLPRDGEPVRFVDATVVHPERLFDLGLISVKKGDRIKLLCVGENQWRIRHSATGLVIFFSTEPPETGNNPS
jgi:hypothetical protein